LGGQPPFYDERGCSVITKDYLCIYLFCAVAGRDEFQVFVLGKLIGGYER